MINHNIPLTAIRAFSAVYQNGGIRSASRELNISHSSVSRHVRYLEEWIGVPLLDRDNSQRTLVFTSQGEKLGQAAIQSLNILANAVVAVKETRPRNSVTISTTPSFASRWLLRRIANFNTLYPWIEVSVITDQRLSNLSENGADIGIRMGKGNSDDEEYAPFMDELLFPVASPEYFERLRLGDDLDCLRKVSLLHDRDPQSAWDLWRESFHLEWMEVNAGSRFASSDLVLDAAVEGLGVALARGRLAELDISQGRLIRFCSHASISIKGAYRIALANGEEERMAVSIFVKWLTEQAEKPIGE